MNKPFAFQTGVLAVLACFLSVHSLSAFSAEAENRYKIENQFVKFGLSPRTPEQMAAFYEGREFPTQAVAATTQHCFITVGMRNVGKTKIWLDLNRWRIYNAQGPIERTGRDQWKAIWQKLDVPLASQATFSWTLLPESRDLHPDEPVGGNITLQPTDTSFTIEAIFATGDDQHGKPLVIKIDNVRCLKNGESNS
ncbi:MAG TPA: hypothetical protein VIM41_16190 [Gammaproteobacteria bacterium]